MDITIFGKQGCAKCETTKNKIKFFVTKWEINHKINITFHDMDTIDGMAEGAYYDVLAVPTTILKNKEEVIARWDGEVPHSDKIKEYVTKIS